MPDSATPQKLTTKKAGKSTYLTAALYAQLDTVHSRDRGPADAPHLSAAMGRFLAYEARLLDECRFEEWIDLFTEQCIYWVPSANPPTPAASTVSITLDDRRRIEDRIVRYRTGYAYSQMPLSRMTRTLSVPECWLLEDGTALVRTGFHISELRREEINVYAGHYEHIIEAPEQAPRIQQKRVHLLAADQLLKNISFIF